MNEGVRRGLRRGWRGTVALSMTVGLLSGFNPLPAHAATVLSAKLTGGAGTYTSADGTLYAKQGQSLTLTVTTDSQTKCVSVAGVATQTSGSSPWTFPLTAGAGDGKQTLQITAGNGNNGAGCNGNVSTTTASYTLDNTGPVLTPKLSPAPTNSWNNAPVTVTWSATDDGSGVVSTSPAQTFGDNGIFTASGSATDHMGNTSTASTTVQVDQAAPSVSGTRVPGANGFGWNNTPVTVTWSCVDNPATNAAGLSGSCPGQTVISKDGANQTATSPDVYDVAGNKANGSVGNISIDTVKPTLSGAPTTQPTNGWYNGDVTIHWSSADVLSGVDPSTVPADSTVTGEGKGLTVSASVSDKAGNTTTTASAPVNIDRTPPVTTATAPAGWTNQDAAVTLTPFDNLSGIAATYYSVDGGTQQTGTSVAITTEGDHTLTYWSVDNAGNTEAQNTIHVKVDKTAPTISHVVAPLPNLVGWNNSDVTITFTCGDSLSGVKSCTAPQPVSSEGANQTVTGTAVDNAGNTATDPATVNIDKTKPTVAASTDRAPNGNGWYNAPVTVSFSCGDALSGVATCSKPVTLDKDGAQSATGTATDAAGNSASTTLGSIQIDQTPPTITGTVVTKANANGWYNGSVTVHWSCSDTGSGLASDCPADTVLSSEGANQSASASVADNAGNTGVGEVTGINIDLAPPQTTASVPAPLKTGWYAGAVPVTLNAADPISGVGKTLYTVDGGAPQAYTGTFTFDQKGQHSITFWSVDNAGNTEDAGQANQTITLKIDGIPPTIAGAATTSPNANNWYAGDVTVHFQCSDAESGIKSCTPDTTLTDSRAGQSVTGTAVDNAGNSSDYTVGGINVDTVAPTLSGAPTTPANGNGWYNGDVTIHWNAGDALSGIDPNTTPGDSTITAEGKGLTASASVSDLAGNSTSATSTPVNIDRTPPAIAGAATTQPNAAGWYNGDVNVHWACVDQLSDIASCPADTTVTGEGYDLSVSGTAYDNAGNNASYTVNGIKIDRTAPNTTVTAPAGWSKDTVTVTLDASDNLSGIAATHYTVDGGDVQTGKSVSFDTDGIYTLRYWSVDNAGNAETPKTIDVKVDKTAPTISHVIDPAPNAAGWNNRDLTVSFTCGDNLSGVASCTDPVNVTTEGVNQDASGTAVDNAGNSTTDPVTVSLDKTPPTVSGAPDRPANGDGWYNADVTVHFTCGDGLSGVKSCPTDTTLTEGQGQSVKGTATDAADNSADATVSGINIDETAPTLSVAATTDPNGNGWYNGDVTVAWSCSDALSGLDGTCPADSTITGSGNNLSATATVADKAGNATSKTVSGIQIDRLAPTTVATVADPLASGWYAGPVKVTLNATDDLSGVATTYYQVDNGDPQSYTGTFIDSLGGVHTISYWSTDQAGNVEPANTLTIKIDDVPPTVTAHASPASNSKGWNNSAVTVSFTCSDDQSGVASCPASVTVDGPAKAKSVSGTAVDNAGNTATATVNGINVDQDAPVLTGQATTDPNAAGWYNGDVTVHWTCSDATSGIDGNCPADSTVAGEGANLTATASVSDNAGNSTSASVAGLQIDRTAPATTAVAPSAWVNANVTVALTATDNLSGVAATHYTVNGGAAQTGDSVELGEGTWTLKYWSVDNAGNTETAKTATVRIDKTAPLISHALSPEPNGAGWNNSDVTVTFTCTDEATGSGVASCTDPQQVTKEAQGQKVAGTATDNAGNSASDTATVNLDKTPPTISGAPDRTPDSNGWYNRDVTVTFTCADNLSGATCPAPANLGEGKAKSVTGTATDAAGNQASDSVSGINVDETAPMLSGKPDVTGWTNGDVSVHWTCADALSGIPAGSCPTDSTVTGEGANLSATATVSDVAGNSTTVTVSGIEIDRTAPSTHASVAGNAFNGWYAGPATVSLMTDSDLSGVAKTLYTLDGGAAQSYDTPFTVGGGQHTVKYWSVDNAGNVEKAQSVMVNVDNINPTITGAATTQPNANGWYAGPVTVHFTCADGETGVATCPADLTLTTDGKGQYVTGTVTDQAGNTAAVKVGPFNIDTTAPSVSIGGVQDGASYTLGSVPTPTCSAGDALSGLTGSCTGTVNKAQANSDGTGSYTYTAVATDKAGNTTTVSATYQVGFRWDGFLQPVTNTAHDLGTASVFKAGSTVPLKFQLKNASGAVVQPSWAPTVTSLTEGPTLSGSTTPAAYDATSTIGSSFKYDATAQQWVFNWSTKGLPAGYYYTVCVKLDDGTTKSVIIGLR